MPGCHAFIAGVIRAADDVRRMPPSLARRELALALLDAFVPRLIVLGIDIRRWIAPGASRGDRTAWAERLPWDPRGFRPELVSGGQDDEVLRHLAAAAAAVLVRRRILVWAATLVDWLQGRLHRRHDAESRAEIAGNRAGARLGDLLVAYLNGRVDREALEAGMCDLLCTAAGKTREQHADRTA